MNLINDILDISMMEAGEMSLEIAPLSVAEITGECLAYIERSAAEKQIEIQLDLDPWLCISRQTTAASNKS